uniref:Uncharacterized protein n=1 Tax=Arundo donax TaxID=35708 RepID=A0A0A8Y2C1_ARUDO
MCCPPIPDHPARVKPANLFYSSQNSFLAPLEAVLLFRKWENNYQMVHYRIILRNFKHR